MTLAALLWGYRAPFGYDWRTRFGLSLRVITDQGPERMHWSEAWDLTQEILRDPWSHTVSAIRGDKYIPHPATVAAADLFEGWVNAKKKKGTIPFHASRPWEGTPTGPGVAGTAAPAATPQDSARRRHLLAQRLGLPA